MFKRMLMLDYSCKNVKVGDDVEFIIKDLGCEEIDMFDRQSKLRFLIKLLSLRTYHFAILKQDTNVVSDIVNIKPYLENLKLADEDEVSLVAITSMRTNNASIIRRVFDGIKNSGYEHYNDLWLKLHNYVFSNNLSHLYIPVYKLAYLEGKMLYNELKTKLEKGNVDYLPLLKYLYNRCDITKTMQEELENLSFVSNQDFYGYITYKQVGTMSEKLLDEFIGERLEEGKDNVNYNKLLVDCIQEFGIQFDSDYIDERLSYLYKLHQENLNFLDDAFNNRF